MTLERLLFSFSGRISRAKFWLGLLVYLLLERVLYATWKAQKGPFTWPEQTSFSNLIPTVVGFVQDIVPLLAWLIIPFWCLLALGVKRLHDRGKTGWWMLVFVLPGWLRNTVAEGRFYPGTKDWPEITDYLSVGALAILVWALIELGLLPGTSGANRYDDDPLDRAKG